MIHWLCSWIHSVTSVRIGIQTTGPLFFGGTVPDLVVTGPNVGTNLGSGVLTSGTVCVANHSSLLFPFLIFCIRFFGNEEVRLVKVPKRVSLP